MDDAFRSGFASALLDVLFNRLADFIGNEVSMIWNVDESLRKLETGMMEARNQLNMVDHFQGNVALRRRADEVASFCYDADDLIDDIDREIKKRKSASKSRNPVRHTVKPVKKWLIPRRIDELHKKLVEITEDLRKNLNLSQLQIPLITTTPCDEFFSSNQQLKLVGRDKDISAIINELTCLGKCDSNGVSIVGMRGLGKTALAHGILNHEKVQAKFPLILRASMSGNNFNREDIISKLVIVHDNRNTWTLNGYRLDDLLARERWLILIDNLSEVPVMAWRDFQTSYLTTQGRKLLITTLNPKVAVVAQTTVYYLKLLPDEHCQELVAHELTLLRNCYVIPRHVSNTLAKMSYGLPLIAIFLGWSLARRIKGKDLSSSLLVEEDLWSWPTFRKEILPILRSSFLGLEPHLKKCFVYFSLFSEGYHFDAENLILLWMGEGLVRPHGSNGWDNFNGLLEKSILQPLPLNHHRLMRYNMHKFTHYFSQFAGSKTFVRLGECASGSYQLNANTRHLSVSHCIQPQFWDEIKHLRGLRTFLSLYDIQLGRVSKIPHDFFKKVSRLRVLSLEKTDITELPDSIDRLKHLRYLDVSNTPIQKLPETLSTLSTLQILRLKKANGIPCLPKNFCDLTNLVFVDWDKGDIKNLQSKPCNIGNLVSLRTLPFFVVGDKEGYHITELKDMKHLEGSICISNLEKVKDGIEAKEAMLSCKFSLERLELEWRTLRNDTSVGDVLVGLKPHDNLKELQIVKYGFHAFPQWLSHLPMLETLHLKGCHCIELPALGQLPTLKTLHLEEMSRLRYLDHNFSGAPISGTIGCFPSLESLILYDMEDLREWTGLGANDMPRLCKLEIVDCPHLEGLPSMNHLTSFVDLQIECCEALCSLPELAASLQSLTIIECDLLKNRCQLGGEDWSKVNCIQKLQIDGIEVPTSAALHIHSPISEPENYSLQGFQSLTLGASSIFTRLF